MPGILRAADDSPRAAPHPEWVRRLLRAAGHEPACAPYADAVIHLAVLREPHLARILAGEKSVEARFCRVRRPPMGQVHPRHLILLKRAAGPVVGCARVRTVNFIDLRITPLDHVRVAFDAPMGRPGAPFWRTVAGIAQARPSPQILKAPPVLPARFVTMIELTAITTFEHPIKCDKSDRRGWVVLQS